MRQLFKGGNYSREETINYYDFLSATTIQGRKLFAEIRYIENKNRMLCSMRTIVLLRTSEMFQFDQIYGTHVRGLINNW